MTYDTERARRIAERRRSNAGGPHHDRRTRGDDRRADLDDRQEDT